jgi:hypothetical protein
MKCGSARKYRRKFLRNFRVDCLPSRQKIHNLVNKFRTTGLLIDKKQKHKCRVLTEQKLDDIGARLEHTPRNSLKCLAQETGVSTCRARTATQLLKLRPLYNNRRRSTSLSYWMYAVSVTLGRQKYIQMSRYCLILFLLSMKLLLQSWKGINRHVVNKFRQNWYKQ